LHNGDITEYNALQYYAAIEGFIKVIGNIYENPELLKSKIK